MAKASGGMWWSGVKAQRSNSATGHDASHAISVRRSICERTLSASASECAEPWGDEKPAEREWQRGPECLADRVKACRLVMGIAP